MSGPAFRARAQLDSPQIVTIASLAAQSGRYFGAAVRMEYLRRDLDRDLRDAVEAECSLLTPEIDLKWDVIEQGARASHAHPDGRSRQLCPILR